MGKEKHDFTPKFDRYGKRCEICGKQEYWCGRDQWKPTGPCPGCGDDSSTTWISTYDDIQGVMNYVCSNCGFSPTYESPAKEAEQMEEYDTENREPITKYLDGFQTRHRIHKVEVDAVNGFTIPTDATVLKWDGRGIIYYSIPSLRPGE